MEQFTGRRGTSFQSVLYFFEAEVKLEEHDTVEAGFTTITVFCRKVIYLEKQMNNFSLNNLLINTFTLHLLPR